MRVVLGLKIKFKNHILVGVDTSGSVNTEELKEFFNELAHMYKTGHRITVAQCDTHLGSVKEFNPKKDWEIHGRGGTSFQPVIDHYNENKGSYTALIYLTDEKLILQRTALRMLCGYLVVYLV